MHQNSILSLKDIWKIYTMDGEEVPALKNINLDIKEGEFISILGPSGSGKSTLLHIIGLLDEPTKGQILLNGKNVSTLTENERAYIRGKEIGFIFQSFNLISNLTVRENVALPSLIYNQSQESANEKSRIYPTDGWNA